ncbi:hypothetical protein IKE71_03465 [Candidatus Saccharibacteria bacterium]|nr:hypothetical protein [Candidatus Saccharibacteria bacterium]
MYKKGDTLIEVMFAVGIFGLASVGTISLMNRGLATSQTNLEVTMARQEIDAQAESLRFIHNAYLSESSNKPDEDGAVIDTYRELWQEIVSHAYSPDNTTGGILSEDANFYTRQVSLGKSCNSIFTTVVSNGSFGVPSRSFIINPRKLNESNLKDVVAMAINVNGNVVNLATTYPRLLYGTDGLLSDAYSEDNHLKFADAETNLTSAEGIWITAVKSSQGVRCSSEGTCPDYYDFHIQTCWDSVSGSATTISSTIRLFNPDQINLQRGAAL